MAKDSKNVKLVKNDFSSEGAAKKLSDGNIYILKDLVKDKNNMVKKGVVMEDAVDDAQEVEEFDESALEGLDSMSD